MGDVVDYDEALRAFERFETALLSNNAEVAEEALETLHDMRVAAGEGATGSASVGDGGEDTPAITTQDQFFRESDRRCAAASMQKNATFTLNRDQLRVKRHVTGGQRSILLYHGTGRGKTCAAISVAEHFMGVVFPSIASAHVSMDRRPLILVPAHLKSSFTKQLLDASKLEFSRGKLASDVVQQCVGNRYLKMIPDRFQVASPEALQIKASRMISSRFYHIMSHMEFANYIERIEAEVARVTSLPERRASMMAMRLRRLFSDRVIVVDEVHNLRIDNTQDESSKKVPPRLMQVLKAGNNVRLLLMSATPMFNDAREIVFIANLILANEKERPLLDVDDVFEADGLPSAEGERRIRRALFDRVSCVTGEDHLTFPLRLTPLFSGDAAVLKTVPTKTLDGEAIPERTRRQLQALQIIAAPLRGAAKSAYQMVVQRYSEDHDDGDDDDDDEESIASDFHVGLQACNVAFPGVLPTEAGYGTTGVSRCLRIQNPRSSKFTVEYAQGVPHFLGPELCNEHAPKIHNVVGRVSACRGKALVYSAYKLTGVLPVALALEHAGFTRYPDVPMLVGSEKRRSTMRYIVWTGDKTMCCEDSHLDVFNSPENSEGDIIKVLICTRRGSEGLDMKALREVHVLDPWYNMSRIEQVVGRGARNCSHAKLPALKRNVTVYLHAVTIQSSVTESIDLRVYRIACRKQDAISRIDKILRDVSIERKEHSSVEKVPIRLKAMSSQGVDGQVTLRLPVNVQRGKRKRSTDARTVEEVIRLLSGSRPEGELLNQPLLKVEDMADSVGVSPAMMAEALERLSHTGAYKRIGDRYVSRPQATSIESAQRNIVVIGATLGQDVRVLGNNDSVFQQFVRSRWEQLSEIVSDSRLSLMQDVVVDACVDALPSQVVFLDVLLASLHGMASGDALCSAAVRSLKRGHVLFEDNGRFCAYDLFDEAYLSVERRGDRFVVERVSVSDDFPVKEYAQQVEDKADAVAEKISVSDVYGVSARTARQGFVFKMFVREAGTGHPVVCATTPALTSASLNRIVQGRLPNLGRVNKKKVLCDASEISLRAAGLVFRPAWWLHAKSRESFSKGK